MKAQKWRDRRPGLTQENPPFTLVSAPVLYFPRRWQSLDAIVISPEAFAFLHTPLVYICTHASTSKNASIPLSLFLCAGFLHASGDSGGKSPSDTHTHTLRTSVRSYLSISPDPRHRYFAQEKCSDTAAAARRSHLCHRFCQKEDTHGFFYMETCVDESESFLFAVVGKYWIWRRYWEGARKKSRPKTGVCRRMKIMERFCQGYAPRWKAFSYGCNTLPHT